MVTFCGKVAIYGNSLAILWILFGENIAKVTM